MTKLIFALIQHIVLILTFRHNGVGLPQASNSTYFLIAALSFLVNLLHTSLLGGSLVVSGLIAAVVITLVAVAIRPTPGSALLLAGIGVELIQCVALLLFGAPETPTLIGTQGMAWKLAAFAVVVHRLRQAHKKSPPSKPTDKPESQQK